mgnify:CR=1 FL=1
MRHDWQGAGGRTAQVEAAALVCRQEVAACERCRPGATLCYMTCLHLYTLPLVHNHGRCFPPAACQVPPLSLITLLLLHCPCTCRTLACAARDPPVVLESCKFSPTSWTAGSWARGGEGGKQLARGRGSSDLATPATRWCWQPTGPANPCHESSNPCKPAASGVGGLHRGGHAGGDVAASDCALTEPSALSLLRCRAAASGLLLQAPTLLPARLPPPALPLPAPSQPAHRPGATAASAAARHQQRSALPGCCCGGSGGVAKQANQEQCHWPTAEPCWPPCSSGGQHKVGGGSREAQRRSELTWPTHIYAGRQAGWVGAGGAHTPRLSKSIPPAQGHALPVQE